MNCRDLPPEIPLPDFYGTETPVTSHRKKKKDESAIKGPKALSEVQKDRIEKMAEKLAEKVYGQDEAIRDICELLTGVYMGLNISKGPLATFMFTGPTGVGKTMLARALHNYLTGRPNSMVFIECGQLGRAHEMLRLIGAPSSYIGYNDGSMLLNKVAEDGFCVVLFDEFEKAHPSIQNRLLQMLDEGFMYNNKGELVDFSQTIIIITSNIGSEKVRDSSKRVGFGSSELSKSERRRVVTKEIEDQFKPEFINRIDCTIEFNKLGEESHKRVIKSALVDLVKALRKKGIRARFNPKLIDYIYDNCPRDGKYGARLYHRYVQKEIAPSIARQLMSRTEEVEHIDIDPGNGTGVVLVREAE